jgi:uncharacterized protein (DUF58 family)
MAIGYGNNIQYFFVFLLVSMGITTAWTTNRNIEALEIEDLMSGFLYAEEENTIFISLKNQNILKSFLWDLDFSAMYADRKNETTARLGEMREKGEARLNWKPARRGYVKHPRILIRSEFPFHLFRAWKYYDKVGQVMVYPARVGLKNIQSLMAEQPNRDEADLKDNEGLFRDFREFQTTDSPSRIDWRRSVKHQKHLVKNYEKAGERKIVIDWDMTKGIPDFEARIKQMAFWVDQCYQANENYSMRIGSMRTDFNSNVTHYRQCMEKLAQLQPQDVVA